MINTATRDLVSGIAELEREVAEEKGDILFFALVRRDDLRLFDSWDLVVAALWASEDRAKATAYLVEKIKSTLGTDTLLRLARIVIFDADDASVQEYAKVLQSGQEETRLRNVDFFGVETSEAYVFTS